MPFGLEGKSMITAIYARKSIEQNISDEEKCRRLLRRKPHPLEVDLPERTRQPVESRWGHQIVFIDV